MYAANQHEAYHFEKMMLHFHSLALLMVEKSLGSFEKFILFVRRGLQREGEIS
jgi:hypothetical protein